MTADLAPADGAVTRPRAVSLRGAGPAGYGKGAGGVGNLPTAEAAAMNPGALRGASQGRDLDSLAHALFLRIYPVIGAVLLITQCAIAYLNYTDTISLRTEQAESLARITAAAIGKPGWSSDPATAKAVRAVAAEPSVRRAALRDPSGRLLATAGEDVNPRAWGIVSVSAPVSSSPAGEPEGSLVLVVSGENLRGFAQQQALLAMGAILVLMLAFVLTLHLNVRRHVLSPLQKLLAAMGQVERKSWGHVDLGGRHRPSNEIDSVCLAFNRMVDGLQSGDEAKQLLARLEDTHGKLEAANRLVMESIGYARRIQSSTLPARDALAGSGLEVDVLWEPLQLVGGDYYWMEELDDVSVLIVADCTGHGVPGAFLTLIVAFALDQILHINKLRDSAAILTMLDGMVRARLRQDGRGSESDDGLDCGICIWKRRSREVVFAGAGMSLTYLEDGQAHRLRGGRRGLGFTRRSEAAADFEEMTVPVRPGTSFFLMTDGVSDQMGGMPRRLLGQKGVSEILLREPGAPIAQQLQTLRHELGRYRGSEKARDDMTVIGFRLKE